MLDVAVLDNGFLTNLRQAGGVNALDLLLSEHDNLLINRNVKLHPIIKKMIGDEVLAKMGARNVRDTSGKPAFKTKIVKPKRKSVTGEKKTKTKKVVH